MKNGSVDAGKASENEKATAKRVTVVFAPQTYTKLTNIAERKGITHTEALRQSISLTDYIERAISENAKIFVERDGRLSELLIH